jgi:predicted TIM-barrel fold metal-dependent hydrolase
VIDKVGVQKTIFVQTQHNMEENRWVLSLADRHDWIAGVVGGVDLASPRCEEQLLEFIDHPKFVGVRHITQDEPDDDFIVRPDVLRGLKVLQRHGVPFDLLFYVKHLCHAATLARQLPELPMVIDHLAKPNIREQMYDDWVEEFQAASEFPNIYCKLSGMATEANKPSFLELKGKPLGQILRKVGKVTRDQVHEALAIQKQQRRLIGQILVSLGAVSEDDVARGLAVQTGVDAQEWSPSDLRPYVQAALEFFGPQRLMFGSDWPVCLLAGSHERVFHALNEALGPISQLERHQIFGDTARTFYRLDLL